MNKPYVDYPRGQSGGGPVASLEDLRAVAEARALCLAAFCVGAFTTVTATFATYFAYEALAIAAFVIFPLVFGQVLSAWFTFRALRRCERPMWRSGTGTWLWSVVCFGAPCLGLVVPLIVSSTTGIYFSTRKIKSRGVRPTDDELVAWIKARGAASPLEATWDQQADS
ncbi:MAG: hypothetical protein JSS65_03670 [Armatimonadetes bacterium]|nr:hypothetical protein [Armatimonadota bacterium]